MHQHKLAGPLILFWLLVAVCLVSSVWASSPDWTQRTGTIGNALSLVDGSQVSLDAVIVEKIKANDNPAYFTIHECFSAKDKLVVLTQPSSELRMGMEVDVSGTISTLSNGERAIINPTVYGYTDKDGNLLCHGPLIKGLLEPTPWEWKVNLTESASSTDNSSSTTLPDTTAPDSPTYYSRVSDILPSEANQTQTQGVSVQSYYGGIGELTGLAAGSLVELQCKRITAVGTEIIDSITYKYLDITENSPATDTVRAYYSAGSPTTDMRLKRVTGQIRYIGSSTTPILCIDNGPGYDATVLEGALSLVSPGSIAYAETLPNGTTATISGKVITANDTDFPDAIYVQETTASGLFGGIRVTYSGSGLDDFDRGDTVTVTGTVALGSDYEREINATSITSVSTASYAPFGMPNKVLGGGDLNVYTPGVNWPSGTGVGLYNKGLLAKIWGKVTSVDAANKCFYIDDGTGFVDGSGHTGVKVSWAWTTTGKDTLLPPQADWYVAVTGISGSEDFGSDRVIRTLRPRDQNDILICKGGTPIAENPAPGWAEDVVPADSCAAGDSGPSSADSVDLATGAGLNDPDPDLVVDNPYGPSAAFSRSYRSTLAESGYASPGLSLGWTHNYDVKITGTSGSWGNLTLVYPNGAQETLTPVISGNSPTGSFTPSGAPYFVTGSATSTPGQWDYIQITFQDETSWRFIATDSSSPNTYLLTRIYDILGHYISINRVSTTDRRLASITDENSNTLLSFAYSSGYLQSATDVSVSGDPREVDYTFATEAGSTVLKSVSQINASSSLQWNYTYTAINSHPYLTWVEAPDPTGASAMRGHPINYNSDGKVSSLVDANGNTRSFIYNGTSTQVFVKDSTGKLAECWTQKIGTKKQDLGIIDAKNNATSIEYTSDYKPYRFTNKDSQTTQLGYDSYGNVTSVTDPRNVITTYGYDPNNPFRLTSVQEGSKTSTTFDYYTNGLLWKVNSPKPGTAGTGDRVTTTYTYTTLGNVSTVTAPAPTDTSGALITTTFDYTSDADYGITGVTEKYGQPLRVSVYDESNNLLSRAHFRYDDHKRLEEVIDGITVTDATLRHRTNFVYNDADQVTEVWYAPTGTSATARAHAVNNYVSVGGALESVDFYDESGNLFRSVTASNGNEAELLAQSGDVLPSSYAYDALYRVKQITDGRSYATTFGYDNVGNPVNTKYPGGEKLSWQFDADHNINKRIDGKSVATSYTLDSIDSRLTDVNYPSGTDPHFDYDSYGRVTQMTDTTGTVAYTYDDNDQVLTVTTTYTGVPAVTSTYSYYPDGSRKSMVVSGISGSPSSLTYNYTYSYDSTELGRIVKTSAPWMTGSTQDQCIYNVNGQIVLQKTPRVQTRYTYNARGYMASLSNMPSGSGAPESYFTGMEYDAAGNLTGLDYNIPAAWSGKQLTGTITYTYDDLNRLTREQRTDSSDSAYSYDVSFTPDAADNLTLVRDLSLSFDSNNQVDGYSYDDNGNVTSSRSYGFTYDYEDLPTGVTSGMYGDITMHYRADGLRAWKSSNNGGWFSYYIYDGDTVLCELSSTGALGEAYLYGANGLIQRRAGSSAYYTYTFDPLGSHVQTGYYSSSNSTQRFTVYDAFGKRWWDKTASGGNTNAPGFVGFAGQWGAYTDHETRQSQTDSPLVLMGVRYYDPIAGRFVSRDPEGEGLNEYVYCDNNPVLRADPFGLDWLDNTSNFCAALGDNISFGLTGRVRQWIGADDVVDRSSGWYKGGTYTSYAYDVALTVATCGASSAAHAGVDAAKAGKAVKVAATAGKASKKLVGRALQQAGKPAEKAIAKELEKQGYEILGEQVSVRTSQGLRRWDFLVKKGKDFVGIEVKSGGSAYTKAQRLKDVEIAKKGGLLVGKKAAKAIARRGGETFIKVGTKVKRIP